MAGLTIDSRRRVGYGRAQTRRGTNPGGRMKILIGYDGSQESRKALDIVKQYARIS